MTTGLRERKREQSRTRIERAALDLMLERGYDSVTVDMICERAEISRRTFFNYFGSKEIAVLGEGPGELDPAAEETFVHGKRGEILPDLARMMFTLMSERPDDVDPQVWRDRLSLIRRHPELGRAVADRMAAKNASLQSLVERRIRRRYEESGDPAGSEVLIRRQAGFIVAMWWGIARHSVQTLVESPTTTQSELTQSLLDTLTLIQEAEL